MLPPQKISERARETRRIFQPEPPTAIIRLWHAFNGPAYFGLIALAVSFARFDSRFLAAPASTSTIDLDRVHDNKKEADPFTLFFIIGYITVAFPIFHLAMYRKDYARVSDSVIAAAEPIEKLANFEQMRKILKLTRLSRKLLALYLTETFCNICMALTLWYYSAGPQRSSLSIDPMYYHLINRYVEPLVIPMGISSGASTLMYHLDVSLCQACLYDILGERFRNVSTRESLNELIKIHQLLLKSSAILQQTFETEWCYLLFNYLLTITVTTFIMIALYFHVALVVLTLSLFVIMCRICLLSEMITTSSRHIGFSVYRSNWVNAGFDLRRDLSVVIARSQKPVHTTAGVLGKLNLVKVTNIVNDWYKLVQALLNFT